MAAALRRFGFEVIEKKNLTRENMDATFADFGRRIAGSDAALFYYAGWASGAELARASFRFSYYMNDRYFNSGFRLVAPVQ